jgi:hypothetical protein
VGPQDSLCSVLALPQSPQRPGIAEDSEKTGELEMSSRASGPSWAHAKTRTDLTVAGKAERANKELLPNTCT